MRILIAIGSKEYSEPTLRAGMKVAKAFMASVTILYVGQKISAFSTNQVRLAQENLNRWDLEHPGVGALEWAFQFLAENKYIIPQTIKARFKKNTLVGSGGDRYELFLQDNVCENVSLILRNGNIIPELRDEVAKGNYDVTIIGGSQKRRMGHDLVQYIDSSIFVVKEFNDRTKYRLLMATDDSRGTNKALVFAGRISKAFDMPVDILTVSKKNSFGPGYHGAAERADRYFKRLHVDVETFFKVGTPEDVIIEEASHDHIIVMGVSKASPLKKIFVGSKPLKVMERCRCPILIIK